METFILVGDRAGDWQLRFEPLGSAQDEEETYIYACKPTTIFWPDADSHVSYRLVWQWIATCLPELEHALEQAATSMPIYTAWRSNGEHGVCHALAALYEKGRFGNACMNSLIHSFQAAGSNHTWYQLFGVTDTPASIPRW